VPNTQRETQIDKHTDTQTALRATSVAIGRIFALRAGDEA